ncbi:MAG: diphthine--ammonia ligase [Candidatus Ranarchaeia archaeon]|jgi:ABC transporter with metal-binding/Fe-S-binding domain ATP-binding protein
MTEYVALLSGGKDSLLALDLSRSSYNVDTILTMFPENRESYMFHTPALEAMDHVQKALNIPLVKISTPGEKEKEVIDLHQAIRKLNPKGIVAGAIASTYQRDRLKKICDEESIELITPLWNKESHWVIQTLLSRKYEVIFVGVGAQGLTQEWLGRTLNLETYEELKNLEKKYHINVSGEGGEYETLVLDAPHYRYRLDIKESLVHWEKLSGWLELKKIQLKKKS